MDGREEEGVPVLSSNERPRLIEKAVVESLASWHRPSTSCEIEIVNTLAMNE